MDPANVTVVRTADELQQAARDLARDIEIQAHLDLRGLVREVSQDLSAVLELPTDAVALLNARMGMRSIRVRTVAHPHLLLPG